MQVIVDNLLTNYHLQGKGKLVLFLHGWGDNSLGSTELQKQLAQKYQVLAPDLPGFGKTQLPPKPWDLDDYANFINHLLTKLQLPQPYALMGHSNGGAIAVRAAAQGVLKPEKIVLLAAAGIRSGHSGRRGALKVIAKVGKGATIVLPARHKQALRRRLYNSAGSDMLVVEQLQETFKKTVRQDVQADAMQLTQPTLLLFADNDTSVPKNSGQMYKTLIPKAELHQVAHSGHFLHLDQGPEVTTAILDFIK